MNHEEHSTVSRKLIEGLEHADLSRRGFLHLVGGLGAMIGMGGWAGSASAAARAGLKTGDLLLQINGRRVSKIGQVRRLAEESDTRALTLKIVRDQTPQTISIKPEN